MQPRVFAHEEQKLLFYFFITGEGGLYADIYLLRYLNYVVFMRKSVCYYVFAYVW